MNNSTEDKTLTSAGRSYTQAAAHLERLTRRRIDLLEEYKRKSQGISGVLQELTRTHETIDEIIKELSNA